MATKKTKEAAPIQKLTRVPVTGLDLFKPRELTVVIQDAEAGVEYAIDIRELSYSEWREAEWVIPMPTPPMGGYDKNAKPFYNYDDAGFKSQASKVEVDRIYYRLQKMLKLPIPGDTEMERADALKAALPFGVVNTLYVQAIAWTNEWKTRIASRADTFRPGNVSHHASVQDDGVEPDAGLDDTAA